MRHWNIRGFSGIIGIKEDLFSRAHDDLKNTFNLHPELRIPFEENDWSW